MKKGILLMIIVLSTVLILNGCATTTSLTYLPTDMKIVPSQDTGDGKYLGIWTGSWYSQSRGSFINTTLVIEEVSSKRGEVTAVYSWGNGEKDWVRITGTIKDGIIVLKSQLFILTITSKDNFNLSVKFERIMGETFYTNFSKYVSTPSKK